MADLVLQEGKFYRDRTGRKVGPMIRRWCDEDHSWGICGFSHQWAGDGIRWPGAAEPDTDLVAEWTDEDEAIAQAAAAIPPKVEDGGPAFPVSLRAYLAAHAEPLNDIIVAQSLTGRSVPEGRGIELAQFLADAAAAWKVMQADALILALEGGA